MVNDQASSKVYVMLGSISVEIPNIARKTAADIHFPPSFDEKKKYQAVVSGHPIGSCKEQTSGNVYGKAIAEAGFVAAAFDASFQGASGGEPRYIENPEFRVSDFRFVVDDMQTLTYVDPERIGVLGICGGGAYALNATMTNYRFKCCVDITPAKYVRINRELFGGFDPVGTLEKMAAQRTLEASGADRYVVSSVAESAEAAKKVPRQEAKRGTTSNLFSFNSAALAWDAFSYAERLMTRPFMVVVGDKPGPFGAWRDASEIYGLAASKIKHIVVVPSVSHYMLYDKPEAVKPALERVLPFLKEHLGEAV